MKKKKNNESENLKQTKTRYSDEIKRVAVEHANQHNNNSRAADHVNSLYGISIDESTVRFWRNKLTSPKSLKESKTKIQQKRVKPKYPQMEETLLTWIREERNLGHALSMNIIKKKALEICVDEEFKASNGWFWRFVARKKLVKRIPTHVMQKLQENYLEYIQTFLLNVKEKRVNVELLNKTPGKNRLVLCNMDEIPVYFDMTRGTTYHFRGEKNIRVVKTLGHKRRCTIVLAVTADGVKLRPMIIFKSNSTSSRLKMLGSNKLIVRHNANGWITETLIKEWLQRILFQVKLLPNEKLYLIWDKCTVHEKQSAKDALSNSSILFDYIPAGCTSILQPLDVMINKPFKDRLRKLFEEWFANEGFNEKNKTEKGYLKSPSYETICQWTLQAWNDIDPELIKKSFKCCGEINIS
jgi:hypothetical protein